MRLGEREWSLRSEEEEGEDNPERRESSTLAFIRRARTSKTRLRSIGRCT